MTQETQHNCPECDEDVELCIQCAEIIHDDDPKAITGEGTYCDFCYRKHFRGQCTNKTLTQQV
jgi:hypothetical protein